MCAIIGQIGGKINKKNFIKVRDLMKSRGPDDAGIFCDEENSVILGHRRLAILDLSLAGHQPMLSQDGRFVVVFNGEIFNFLELKKELKSYNFKTKTDTEVLLAAYIKWGPLCLNKFNGQFSFVIYDTKSKELFCARDHLGVKPFYYCLENKKFLFASEIKAILGLGIKAKPNNQIIFEYLNYGFYDHSENTFFEGIKKLMPGQYAIYKNGIFKAVTYWDLALKKKEEGRYNDLSEDKIKSEFEKLLIDAIKLQFRSDVPVGLNLSSGLDSLSLMYFADKAVGGNIHFFSGGIADECFDETRILEKILGDKKNNLTKSNLTPDKVWELSDKLLSIQDEPYGGFSTISYFNLYKETNIPKVKVLLEGQGMDEILAGYNYYALKGGLEGLSQDATAEVPYDVLNHRFFKSCSRSVFPAPFKSKLLNKQYRDIRYTKLPRVLRFNDHISLAYSRELRVPYLDYRLVEFCFFLPEKFKIQGDKHKVLLRNVMAKILPKSTQNKPKFTFGAFQTVWLRKYFKKEVYNIIESESFRQRPYWNWIQVKLKVDDFFSGENDNSFFLWQWLNLEMWFRKYIDKQ